MEIGEGGLFLTLSERGNEGKWRKEAVGRTRESAAGRKEGERQQTSKCCIGTNTECESSRREREGEGEERRCWDNKKGKYKAKAPEEERKRVAIARNPSGVLNLHPGACYIK